MTLVQPHVEDAATFHTRRMLGDTPAAAWVLELTRPAIVLGSSQSTDIVDVDACTRRGIDIVRRRSGGGAVLVMPDVQIWIDVVIPVGHAEAVRDVRASMVAFGTRWRSALGEVASIDVGDIAVHTGPMMESAWSRLVCFDGLGPGELTVHGRKLVGMSQRRTREGSRFQSMVYRRDVREELVALLRADVRADDLATPALVDDSFEAADVARFLAPG